MEQKRGETKTLKRGSNLGQRVGALKTGEGVDPPYKLLGVSNFTQCLVQIVTNELHFLLFPLSLLDYLYWGWAFPHYTKCRNDSFPCTINMVDITVFGCFISFQVIAFYNSGTWRKFTIIIVLQQHLNF